MLQSISEREGNYKTHEITNEFKKLARDTSIAAKRATENFAAANGAPEYVPLMAQAEAGMSHLDAIRESSGFNIPTGIKGYREARLAKLNNWLDGYGQRNSKEAGIEALEDLDRITGQNVSREIYRGAVGSMMGTNPVAGAPKFGVPPLLPLTSMTGRSMPMFVAGGTLAAIGGAAGYKEGGLSGAMTGGALGALGGMALMSPRNIIRGMRVAPYILQAAGSPFVAETASEAAGASRLLEASGSPFTTEVAGQAAGATSGKSALREAIQSTGPTTQSAVARAAALEATKSKRRIIRLTP
jgi:hypothetical protein